MVIGKCSSIILCIINFLVIMDIIEEQSECMNNLCTNQRLKVCTRCKVSFYCSKECQVQHWKSHEKCCQKVSSSIKMQIRYLKAIKDYKTAAHQSLSGEKDQALVNFQEALKLFQECQDEYGISNCHYKIGTVLLEKRQHEEALVNFRKALEIRREIHGENHNRTCCCYEWIGNVVGDLGRHDDAFIGYGKALAIRLNLFGEDHLETAGSYYNIGVVQGKKGDYDGALVSLQKAKAIYVRELGVENPKTVKTNSFIEYYQKIIDLRDMAAQLL